MFYVILLSVIFVKVSFAGIGTLNAGIHSRTFIYNVYNYTIWYSIVVNSTTEQILEFTENSTVLSGPTRIHVYTNDTITEDHPLFVSATQQKGISSWEMPLVIGGSQLNNMARTLCPHDAGSNKTSPNRPLVQISTSSLQNVSVQIKLRRLEDFYVQEDKEIAVSVTPSTPKYYFFSFDGQNLNSSLNEQRLFIPSFNYSIPKSVLLVIDSPDDLCALISIQNNSCPVFDNEKDIKYQGYFFTMSTKGAITLTQSMFPNGFYIVFIVKQSDEACTGVSKTDYSDDLNFMTPTLLRRKNFKLKVRGTITYTQYVVGSLAVLGAVVAFYALLCLLTYKHCYCTDTVLVEEIAATTSGAQNADPVLVEEAANTKDAGDAGASTHLIVEDSSSSDSELSSLGPLESPGPPTVAQLCRSKPAVLVRRSNKYFWNALTVSVVYALPVVQLLVAYQRSVRESGDQDMCYYNFLCAHPLGPLSDFNHVSSNLGYLLLGAGFNLQVYLAPRDRPGYGVPQHPGLLYSMGLALAMEGVLSACYHLCPNKMNFQFDSSFMYVLAVLVMVKLYQNRHPDVNARAHTTFMVLAAIMAIGVIGIMFPSMTFWVLFTILHLSTCVYLTLKIYYFGQFRFERSVLRRAWFALRGAGHRALLPQHKSRAVMLAGANLVNVALAVYGIYHHMPELARQLLAILLVNACLHFIHYVYQKRAHKETISAPVCVIMVLAAVAWVGAAILFHRGNTKWAMTAAQSRQLNGACLALSTLDSHDLWHLASAGALALSLCALLHVDRPLATTPHRDIASF